MARFKGSGGFRGPAHIIDMPTTLGGPPFRATRYPVDSAARWLPGSRQPAQ